MNKEHAFSTNSFHLKTIGESRTMVSNKVDRLATQRWFGYAALLTQLVLCLSLQRASHGEDGEGPWKERMPPDWNLLDFDDSYVLTKLRIERRRNTGYDYKNGKVIADITVSDKELLKTFSSALNTAKINPPHDHESFAGLTPVGLLECETTEGRFVVYWNQSFVLNETTPSSRNMFWSAGTAVMIDKILRKNGFEGFSELELNRLTGEHSLRLVRERFEAK